MKFFQVSRNLWRGPRPTPADAEWLNANVSTILSLEGMAEDDKERAEFPGVNVLSCPITPWEIYVSGISDEYLNRILSLITYQPLPRPMLVHCQHGEDRTGLVIGTYRRRAENWSKGQAWAEMLKFGYRNWLNFGLNKTWRKE